MIVYQAKCDCGKPRALHSEYERNPPVRSRCQQCGKWVEYVKVEVEDIDEEKTDE
jgi:hypothetical protein